MGYLNVYFHTAWNDINIWRKIDNWIEKEKIPEWYPWIKELVIKPISTQILGRLLDMVMFNFGISLLFFFFSFSLN